MKHSNILFAAVLLPTANCLLPTFSSAQWSTNPGVNNTICTAANDQQYPQLVSDGSGGAIITWEDARAGGSSDIYTQRIDAAGLVQWTVDGAPICTAANNQRYPQLITDGSGGAIITWWDKRGVDYWDIYARRINSAGAVQWTANGVAVCIAFDNQMYSQLASDGSGGAIITWQDYRGGATADIYARRINSAGAVQWAANGVAICTAAGNQRYPQLITDGSGGAIITWQDESGGGGGGANIYAQRINSAGAVQWAANGVAICTAAGNQDSPQLVSDGSGGAIITWTDNRGGPYYDVYAQRINSSGLVQWTVDGAPICTAADNQLYPQLVFDGSGGAIITWWDFRGGAYWDIYARRINSAGVVQWTANGVPICTAFNDQQNPQLVSDGSGGAIITWNDNRGGTTADIYAQRIDASGAVQWTANGAAVSTATNSQGSPEIVSSGCFIITWQDYRSGANSDIYAQAIDDNGALGGGSCGALPVELLYFTASWLSEIQTDALLQWATASELNNSHFTLERGTDGINFTAIATVPGAGNSSSLINYQYIDNGLPDKTKCDVFYYRLKQTDFDGAFTYSKTEVLTRGSITIIDPAPNPINDELNFTLLSAADGEINITITNMLGQLVKNELRATHKGIQQIKIPLSLASGMYMLFVETSDGAERIQKEFVIK